MVSNRFLAAARQGKNGLGRYGLTIILCLGLTIGVILVAMLPIIIAMVLMGMDSQTSVNALMGNPFMFSIFSAAISALMVFGLWLAFRNLHRRPLLTLIRADQTIRWAQMVKAALVWLGLGLLTIGGVALLEPDRYQVTFVAQDWFLFLIPALIVIPAITLFQGLVYAYLLQGLGLLIRKPARLTIAIALLSGLFSLLGQPSMPSVALMTTGFTGFMVWIVLQNQGLELLLGLMAAMNGLQFLVLKLPDAPGPFPTILQRVEATPDLTSRITLLITTALFYGICLDWPWQRQTPESDGHA